MAVSRLTCILLLVLFFTSQAIGQEIFLPKGTVLDSAFAKVSKSFKVNFAYNPNTIDQTAIISKDLAISSPEELLQNTLSEAYSWKYVGNTIVISFEKKELATTLPLSKKAMQVQLPQQTIEVQSKATDPIQYKLKKVSRIDALINVQRLPSEFNMNEVKRAIASNKPKAIKRGEKLTRQLQPFLSTSNFNRIINSRGTRTSIYMMGAGMELSASKNKWHLSASVTYQHALQNPTANSQNNLSEVDSTMILTDSLPSISSKGNPSAYIKYKGGIGYDLNVASHVIPMEFGISIMQPLIATDDYNKMLYNAYLAIPIQLFNRKRYPVIVTPFLELGLNNDFKDVKFKSKRHLFGLNVGILL